MATARMKVDSADEYRTIDVNVHNTRHEIIFELTGDRTRKYWGLRN